MERTQRSLTFLYRSGIALRRLSREVGITVIWSRRHMLKLLEWLSGRCWMVQMSGYPMSWHSADSTSKCVEKYGTSWLVNQDVVGVRLGMYADASTFLLVGYIVRQKGDYRHIIVFCFSARSWVVWSCIQIPELQEALLGSEQLCDILLLLLVIT